MRPECCGAVVLQHVHEDNLEFSVIIPFQGIVATRATISSQQSQDTGFRIAQKVWRLWNTFHSQDVCQALPLIESPRTRFRDGTVTLSDSEGKHTHFYS